MTAPDARADGVEFFQTLTANSTPAASPRVAPEAQTPKAPSPAKPAAQPEVRCYL